MKFPVNHCSLGCVICFVSVHVLFQLLVFYHHHEENEASYTVWLFCSKYVDYSLFTLSEWLICISSYALFTKIVCSSKSECSVLAMDKAHPRGVASHPIHPPSSAPDTVANLCVKLLLDLCYTPVPSLHACPLLTRLLSNQKKTDEEQGYTILNWLFHSTNAGFGASHVAMVHNCWWSVRGFKTFRRKKHIGTYSLFAL